MLVRSLSTKEKHLEFPAETHRPRSLCPVRVLLHRAGRRLRCPAAVRGAFEAPRQPQLPEAPAVAEAVVIIDRKGSILMVEKLACAVAGVVLVMLFLPGAHLPSALVGAIVSLSIMTMIERYEKRKQTRQ